MNQKKNDFNEEMLDGMLEACEYMVDMISEGQQAEEYKEKKQKEAKQKEAEDEEKYQRRYGARTQTTALNGKELMPDTDYRYTSGDVSHDRIKNSKSGFDKFSAYDRQKHYDKMRNNQNSANVKTGIEGSKREFENNWGDHRRIMLDTSGKYASASDAMARHERRQAKKKAIKETCLYILSALDDIE